MKIDFTKEKREKIPMATFRLTPDMHERLKAVAKKEKTSMQHVVITLLKVSLDEYEKTNV